MKSVIERPNLQWLCWKDLESLTVKVNLIIIHDYFPAHSLLTEEIIMPLRNQAFTLQITGDPIARTHTHTQQHTHTLTRAESKHSKSAALPEQMNRCTKNACWCTHAYVQMDRCPHLKKTGPLVFLLLQSAALNTCRIPGNTHAGINQRLLSCEVLVKLALVPSIFFFLNHQQICSKR